MNNTKEALNKSRQKIIPQAGLYAPFFSFSHKFHAKTLAMPL